MKSTTADHDTLAYRLAEILLKLNLGDPFTREDLATEFKVSERTIFRDLNRLGGIVARLPDGRYQLAPEYRGKLTPRDLETFAKLAGVDNLFPSAGRGFLIALLDTLSQSSFLVRGHRYEHLKPNNAEFKKVDEAIRNCRVCHFTYADKRRTVTPYRLINQNGIWYLAAAESGQLKSFTFGRISRLNITDDEFTPDAKLRDQIEDEDDVWLNPDKTEVLVNVAPQIAYYFERRPLLPKQETVRKLESGGLVVSAQISHANQILPLIRYWLPRIHVLEPTWLKDMLEAELRQYLNQH